MKTTVLFVFYASCFFLPTCLSINSYLSDRDKEQLKNILTSGLDSSNVSDIYYAVSGLKQLGYSIPNVEILCKKLSDSVLKNKAFDILYFSTSTWKLLEKCSGRLQVDESVQSIHAMLEKKDIRDVRMSDLYFGVDSLNNLNLKPKDTTKLINIIKRKMKPDDTITDFGYSINLLASLGPDGRFAYNRLTDAIMQVDQVDKKFLQFEGGLSVTALVLIGIYKFCDAVKCDPTFPLQNDQVLMFSNYFLSRKSVQTLKGAHYLLTALKTLSSNNYHLPIATTLVKPMGGLDDTQKILSVRFTNLLGEPLPTTLSVGVESAMLNNKVVMSKNKFRSTTDKTIYELNFNEPDLSTGIYNLVISASPVQPIKVPLIGHTAIPLEVKVAAPTLDIVDFKVGTTDNDQQTGPTFQNLKYNEKLSTPLKADNMQRIIIRFSVKDPITKKNTQVHQAFIRFTNLKTGSQNVFVAELDSQNNYKLDMDIGVKSTSFKHSSGLYTMDLIIGDTLLKNPVIWKFSDIKLKFSDTETKIVNSFEDFYKPKKLISHTFREPETRPPHIVSLLFTALSLTPLLILFVLWTKLGVNIKNFPFSLSALGFHTGLGGIFSLFVLFWLKLNMFVTLKYLLILGLATFLFGNRLLSHIARRRSKQI
ncbi:dolichyl-diphosphooligosaccharide--protein glycosyltransferase subunit 2 [Daktulosphaira vitifoliae]|uniref:dolichyl-diphosphooligosaccharide--protein glycosyltransferase subunit 2 n=1 Tax=Daktulosphaira vitifoliae TaxID=58002 RepID=UPI0021AA9F94|nr:dolichyl-diphosphooligosaccharide--protein glycosyltransferase subunit 2 [Daktulosphaira vitifoliae]